MPLHFWQPGPDGHFFPTQRDDQGPANAVFELRDRFQYPMAFDEEGKSALCFRIWWNFVRSGKSALCFPTHFSRASFWDSVMVPRKLKGGPVLAYLKPMGLAYQTATCPM
jgi:hypothetical protein